MRLATCACLLATAIATGASAQPARICDPQIRPGDGAYGYRLRGGDRCEGKFEQPTAVDGQRSPLSVISFACRVSAWSLTDKIKPAINWNSDGSAVDIRAETPPEVALRYRMDAKGTSGVSQFAWDAETINALKIKPSEIAVLVRGSPKVGGVPMVGTIVLATLGTSTSKQGCDGAPTLWLSTTQRFSRVGACLREYSEPTGALADERQCKFTSGSWGPSSSLQVELDALSGKHGTFELTLTTEREGLPLDQPLIVRVSTK